MQFRLHTQLVHLDRSNDRLLKMYSCLYCDIPNDERRMLENIIALEELREKLKLKLKCHLFQIKNNIRPCNSCTILIEYLPIFLKLEKLAYSTFPNTKWRECFTREKDNINLYYKALYNAELPTSTIEECLQHRNNLKSSLKR
jgi:hypothetical protein